MKKHLFLTGDIGIGKSSIIKNVILPYILEFVGFYTQRVISDNKLAGFRVCSLFEDSSYTLNTYEKRDDLFIEMQIDNTWIIKDWVFEERFLNFTQTEKCNNKFILLDEIGGFELRINKIRKRLFELLDGDKPILGVIKAPKNKERMRNIIGMENEKFSDQKDYEKLCTHPEINLLTVTDENRNSVSKTISDWLKENQHEK